MPIDAYSKPPQHRPQMGGYEAGKEDITLGIIGLLVQINYQNHQKVTVLMFIGFLEDVCHLN